MGQLSKYVWRYWRWYLVGGLCLFGTATLVMWIPWWIRDAIRIVEQGGQLSDVTYYAVLIIASAIVQGLVRTFSRALIFNAGRNVEFDLRNDIFAHLEKLPLSYYHSQRTGDLMSRVINDISAVRVMLGPGILNFANAPLYYVYAVALMLSMDVRMTLAALAPFPLLMYVARRFRGQIMKSSLEVQQQMSVLSSHVQENLSGIHVVKAYSQEEYQTQQFAGLNKDYEIKSMEMAKLRGIVNPVMQAINGVTVLIVIWYGGVRVMRGDLLVADIVAFIAYLNVLAWPTAAFGWMLSLVERGRAAMRRLGEVLETRPEITSSAAAVPVHGLKTGIEFKNVTSSMAGRRTVTPRSTASISLCRSADPLAWSGESAPAKALWRIWCRGCSIFLPAKFSSTGEDIRELSLFDLRKIIGYVPQDPFLFSSSLRRNLALGRDQYTEEELDRAIKIAKLDRDLEIFPQGLDTLVGERGVTLSGGQKQRATLARALVMDPPVLILDDSLSSVDAQTEAEILHGLRAILKEKTCLIISHRISAVKEADEILVLDEGKIVERGNHEELVAPRRRLRRTLPTAAAERGAGTNLDGSSGTARRRSSAKPTMFV